MKTLIITEKPSASRHFVSYFETIGEKFSAGNNGYYESAKYYLTATRGHVMELKYPEEYDEKLKVWSLENLPMFPKLDVKIKKESKSVYKTISDLIKKSNEIINACDIGREGELIFGLVVKNINHNKKVYRILPKDYELKTIKESLANLIPVEKRENIYLSGRARMEADWIIGMNLSRYYACLYNVKNISIGRVQTPTLMIVYFQEKKHFNFKNQPHYNICVFSRGFEFVEDKSFENEVDANKRAEGFKKYKKILITNVQAKNKNILPPKPFDLTELQKTCNRQFGYTASNTLEIAQKLYEKVMITYPRTDARYITKAMFAETYEIAKKISQKYKCQELLKKSSDKFSFVDDSKITDHFAILPTESSLDDAKYESLDNKEKNVFLLIQKQLITSCMYPCIQEQVSVFATIEDTGVKLIHVTTITKDMGFKANPISIKVKKTEKSETEEKETNETRNPKKYFVKDKEYEIEKINTKKVDQKRPSLLTEASLLAMMNSAEKFIKQEDVSKKIKKLKLGTPATQAEIIDTLKKRNFIETKNKFLITTEKGKNILKICDKQYTNPIITARWETKIEEIAEGKRNFDNFIDEVKVPIKEIIDKKEIEKGVNIASEENNKVKNFDCLCPSCKKNHKFVMNAGGIFSKDDSCEFKLFRKQYGLKLKDNDLMLLIKLKTTSEKNNFVSGKTGKKYSARLVLNSDDVNRAKLIFPERNKKK